MLKQILNVNNDYLMQNSKTYIFSNFINISVINFRNTSQYVKLYLITTFQYVILDFI